MNEDHSARLALPYLAAGQMQKHVTHNEALTRLDALVQTAVESRTVAEPPAEPEDGLLFIAPEGGGAGAWAAFAGGDLLRAEGGAWSRVPAPDGLVAWVRDAARLVVREAGGWVELGDRLGAVRQLQRLGLGADPDAANPFLARLNNALWTARESGAGGDGDLRLTLNKETSADVLSLLFQSGWSGRAEIGLIGDDDLVLKVGDDGGTWREALRVDRASGRVAFPKGVLRREVSIFTGDGGWQPPAWACTVEAVLVGGGGGGGAGAGGPAGDRPGGGGGGAGGLTRLVWSAADLAGGVSVVVGAGGQGGSAGAGQAGGDTRILRDGVQLAAAGGGGGGGAGADGGAAGRGGTGAAEGNRGGASTASAAGEGGAALTRPDGPGGGAAGGALGPADDPSPGGAGGDGGTVAGLAGGGAAGVGGPGGGGEDAPSAGLHWSGGGGGGGASASGAGHPGGAGGQHGGGGGGGGAGTSAGGAGGDGAPGLVWLIAAG
jgi:hypothetical protein